MVSMSMWKIILFVGEKDKAKNIRIIDTVG